MSTGKTIKQMNMFGPSTAPPWGVPKPERGAAFAPHARACLERFPLWRKPFLSGDFDAWGIEMGWLIAPTSYDKTDPTWRNLRYMSNQLRRNLNEAAENVLHVPTPFRVSFLRHGQIPKVQGAVGRSFTRIAVW